MSVLRRRATAASVLGTVLLAGVSTSAVSASTVIRPVPGTPDPKTMVLTSADLGGAKVTLQRYYQDRDFPSVITYERELEDGRFNATPLLLVNSEAEIGNSVMSTAEFLRSLRLVMSTKEGRALLTALIQAELGDESFARIRVGRPRKLGVGPGSLDLPMTLELLGVRTDVHFASFRVAHVLGNVMVLGEPGRRVPLAVMTRLAKIMGARMAAGLVPTNTALPLISGSPAVGKTLTATPGKWSGTTTGFAYQWRRCDAAGAACASIAGATDTTYLVAEDDLGATLRVDVTPRGTAGNVIATSTQTGPIARFIDTFTGDRIDPFWSVGTTGTGPVVVQANGRLEVTLPAGTSFGAGGFANAFALMSCRLPGDFDMQVDYELLSGLLPSGINVEFSAAEFTGATFSGVRGMFVHNAGGDQGISTHFPDPTNSFVSDNSRAGTLRLVRTTSGGVTTITVSRMTGPAWSSTSLPYSAPPSQAAFLGVFTNLSPFPAEIRVAYDNFRISNGPMTCP